MKSTVHTKIFWIVTIGVGLITLLMCLYPYVWLDQHRSGPPKEKAT